MCWPLALLPLALALLALLTLPQELSGAEQQSDQSDQCAAPPQELSGTEPSLLQVRIDRPSISVSESAPAEASQQSEGSDREHAEEGPEAPHKFLAVLMRTGGPQSLSRVASIRSTWGNDLEDGSLVLLPPDPWCNSTYGDNHWRGLTCLEAKGHLHMMNRTDWDWLLVVDDDTYVFAERLRETLRSMDMSSQQVYGVPGCGNCGQGRKGFCGGGGYIISRQNLLRMASLREDGSRDEDAFITHFLHPPDDVWCDVRFACVAQDMNLRLTGVRGLYGNRNDDYERERQIVDLEVEETPLVLHYVSNDTHMQTLYRESQLEQQQASAQETAYNNTVNHAWTWAP